MLPSSRCLATILTGVAVALSTAAAPAQTVDLLVEGASGEQLGGSLDFEGDRLVIGSMLADGPGGSNTGSALVLRRVGGTWTLEGTLVAGGLASNDEFGRSVSISGGVIVVGAHKSDLAGNNSGEAYIFQFNGSSWEEKASLIPSGLNAQDKLGRSVASSGLRVLLGAHGKENQGSFSNSGAAWVYRLSGTQWVEEAMLEAPTPEGGDVFGFSVGLDNDVAVVGAYGSNSARGAAHVFRRVGLTWTPETVLSASDGVSLDEFGRAVSVSGDVAVIGARTNDSFTGAVYVFRHSAGTWTQTQKLRGEDTAQGDRFGAAVSLADGWLHVGATHDDDDGTSSGSSYVFEDGPAGFEQRFKLHGSSAVGGDQFGLGVAVQRSATGAAGVAAGARMADGGDGSAQVFTDLGVWEHRGAPLLGTAGLPVLNGSGPLLVGSDVALALKKGLPGAIATMVIGVSEVSVNFKGGVLMPSPDSLIGPFFVDPTGSLLFSVTWPAGLSGLSLHQQYWILDAAGPVGFSASNGLIAHVP